MVLVTGGSGVMGSVLVRRLREQGNDVRVFVLPNDKNVSSISDFAEVKYGDISQPTDVKGICDGVTTVYHLAAIIISPDEKLYQTINVDGTANLLAEAKKANVEHFIYISSASVTYVEPTPYSLSKIESEKMVQNSGLNYTIIRPTLVYGHTGGGEFDIFVDYLKKWPIVPFIGKGEALKRPVYVGDIVDGLVALCGNLVSYGKTYNFSGGESISIIDFSRLCLRLNGTPKPIFPLPIWFCTVLAYFLELFMKNPPLRWAVIAGIKQDADLDPILAVNEIGYNPKKVSEKLKECFPRN